MRDVEPSWRKWSVVAACLVCQTGMGVGGYVFPVFLKPVVDDLGWSRTDYALANPIMSTMVALVGPFVGWLADRRGPRPILLVGSLLMSAALFAAGQMTSTLHLYAIAVAIGVAVACLGDLPTGAAVASRFAAGRGLALGLVYIGSNVGGTIVPLVGTWLAAGASWRAAFSGVGAVLWIALLPAALAVPRPLPVAAADDRDADVAAPSPAPAAWRQRDFWLLFWVLFAFYLYRLGINVHLVAYLSDLGYSNLEAAGGFSFSLALGIAGKLIAGVVADRTGARPAAVGIFAFIALASILLLAPGVPGAIPAFLVLHGFATAAEDVVMPLLIALRFGTAMLGRVYGALLLALVPGGILGPILAGRAFDLTGSYQSSFALFAVCNLTAVIALAALGRRS